MVSYGLTILRITTNINNRMFLDGAGFGTGIILNVVLNLVVATFLKIFRVFYV
jgi:hypothetical protein